MTTDLILTLCPGPDEPGREYDFYPTPAWVTRKLLEHAPPPPGRVLEPAAGDGAIVRELLRAGYQVSAVEIRPGALGELLPYCPTVNANWLKLVADGIHVRQAGGVPPFSIVTNPPFSLIPEFIKSCRTVGAVYVALLMPVAIEHGRSREQLNRRFRWTRKLSLLDRPFPKVRDCAWYIWEQGKPELDMESV